MKTKDHMPSFDMDERALGNQAEQNQYDYKNKDFIHWPHCEPLIRGFMRLTTEIVTFLECVRPVSIHRLICIVLLVIVHTSIWISLRSAPVTVQCCLNMIYCLILKDENSLLVKELQRAFALYNIWFTYRYI